MEEQLLKLAAGNGIWTTLFVTLFLYTIYDSRNREKKYQQTIEENQKIIQALSNDINGNVKNIMDDVKHIKSTIERR